MIATIPPRDLPAAAGNKLYLDYIAGAQGATRFYTHGALDFGPALAARRVYPYPRSEVVPLLAEYNARLGASEQTQRNVEALGQPDTFCVVTGQQAGFLGGPVYTAFKIATVIRLAAHLEGTLGARFVPVFWLASEDHDFGEINHTFFVQRDGEIGRVAFGWAQEGRPISALPVTEEVTHALDDYWAKARPGPQGEQTRALFTPQPQESFATWCARTWSQLFAAQGLVIVEPRTLRPPAGEFYGRALSLGDEVRARLDEVS